MRIRAAIALGLFLPALPLSAQLLGLSEPHEIELGRRAAAEIEFDPLLSKTGQTRSTAC